MSNRFLDKTCKRSKIEKVNINIKNCKFKLVYSRVSNRRGVGINGGVGGVGGGGKVEKLPGLGGGYVKIE